MSRIQGVKDNDNNLLAVVFLCLHALEHSFLMIYGSFAAVKVSLPGPVAGAA